MKITADIIKTALLSYYRFKKFQTCVDEAICYVENETCDILVDENKYLHDIEIKVSKSDLLQNETKKKKHKIYKNCKDSDVPNRFSLCVPSHLIGIAETWIKSTNKDYGLIEFDLDKFENILNEQSMFRLPETIKVIKEANILHDSYPVKLRNLLEKRLVSAYCNLRQKLLLDK